MKKIIALLAVISMLTTGFTAYAESVNEFSFSADDFNPTSSWKITPSGKSYKEYENGDFYGYGYYYGQQQDSSALLKTTCTMAGQAGINAIQLTGSYGNETEAYTSFGRYDDIIIDGRMQFVTFLRPYAGVQTVKLSLTQGKNGIIDQTANSYDYLTLSYGSSSNVATFMDGTKINITDHYYEVTYTLDISGDVPMHGIKIVDVGEYEKMNNQTILQTDFVPFTSAGSMNLSEPVGMRMRMNAGASASDTRTFILGMSAKKITPLEFLTDENYYVDNPIKPNSFSECVDLEFNKPILNSSLTVDTVKLLDLKGNAVDRTVLTEGNKIRVKANFEGTCRYKLIVDGICDEDLSKIDKIEMYIEVMDYVEIKNVTRNDEEEKTIITAEYLSNSPAPIPCIFVITRLDLEQRTLKGVFCKSGVILPIPVPQSFEFTDNAPIENTLYGIHILSGLEDTTALCADVIK